MDETAFQGAGPRRSTTFVTGIVDLSGATARLLDVVPGRSGTALSAWVNHRPQEWRGHITVAALDPFRGYASALTSSLPSAVRVLDCFHVTRLGFAAVDDMRRRVQNETTGHRGRRADPLYGIRRLLRRRADRLTPHAWARLLTGLEAGDRDAQIATTWIAAQDLRLIYRAQGRADAEQRLHPCCLLRQQHGPRTAPPGPHHRLLARRAAGLLRHRRPIQRTHRSNEPVDQEGETLQAWIPQPAPATAPLRLHQAEFKSNTTPRPATTLGCVEPLNEAGWRMSEYV